MTDEPKQSKNEFRELLLALVRRFGTRDALGKKIGMSGSRVGRAIDGQYAFNITNCLKLAEATGEPPSAVLRAAGKREEAALIERLYGHSRPALSTSERELLDEWEALTPRARESLRAIVRDLLPKKAATKKRGAA